MQGVFFPQELILMSNPNLTAIESCLIRYLKKEGLDELIPEDRRLAALDIGQKGIDRIKSTPGFLIYYLLIYWSINAIIVGGFTDATIFALLGPGIPLVAAFFLGIAAAIITPLVIPAASQSKPQASPPPTHMRPSDPGRLFKQPILLSFPIMLILLNWYWTSWRIAGGYAAIFALMYLAYPRIYDDDTRTDLLYTLRRPRAYLVLGWITFGHMLKLLARLAPLLLVIVLFAVFSQELWQSLGNLTLKFYALGIFIMVFPALIFIVTFHFGEEVEKITKDFPVDQEALEHVFEMMPGRPPREEFAELVNDLKWRERIWPQRYVQRLMARKLKIQLMLLLVLTFSFSIVAFFVYFFFLFYVLLTPVDLNKWGVTQSEISAFISTAAGSIGLDGRAGPIAKVSLLLAVFIAAMAGVYALNERGVKKEIGAILKKQVQPWMAAGYVYLAAVSPNYQILGYSLKNKRRRIASISILVNTGAKTDLILEACRDVRKRFKRYRSLRLLTVYEKSSNGANNDRPGSYSYGKPNKYWHSLPIIGDGNDALVPYPGYGTYDHDIDTTDPDAVPRDWFGNEEFGCKLSQSLLQDNRQTVLHPYVFDGESILSLVVWLRARLRGPEEYRTFVRTALLKLDSPRLLNKDAVTVHFYLAEGGQELFRFFYSPHIRDVAYKGCWDDKMRFQKKRRFSAALV